MSILIDENTRVICQGFTGYQGTFHSKLILDYGTKIVGGVTPGKGGIIHLGLPVFNTVNQAVNKTGANTSLIFVPANFCKDAILEAINANIKLIICITEGIPVLDMLVIKTQLNKNKTLMIGPNSPGIITPGKCKIGIMPAEIYQTGSIGIISRSGTLVYEIVKQITDNGFGQSTCIGIGGDFILGSDFVDILKLFKEDKQTKLVIMIGEIGGTLEEKAAIYIKNNFYKPIISYIAGINSPKNKRMGHAGAIINKNKNTASAKISVLKNAGVKIINNLLDIKQIITDNLILS